MPPHPRGYLPRHAAPSPRRARRTAVVAAAALTALSLLAVPALGYWSGRGAGTGTAVTAALTSSPAVSVPQYSRGSVALTWAATQGPAGGVVTGYYVTRSNGGPATAACGTSLTALTSALSCTDTSVPDGSWTYSVVAVQRSWTATRPAASATLVDSVPPTAANPTPAAATVRGSLTLGLTPSDASSGVAQVTFSAAGTSLGSATAAPYAASWDTTTAPNGTTTPAAVLTDRAGNTAPYTWPFSYTVANPPTNLVKTSGTSTSQRLAWDAVPGATTWTLSRATTNGGPYTAVASNLTTNAFVDTGLVGGLTYYYVVTSTTAGVTTVSSAQLAAATVVTTGYTITPTTYSFTDLASATPTATLVGTATCNDCIATVTTPFPVQWFAQSTSTLSISSNGVVAAGTVSNRTGNNVAIPTTTYGAMVAPFWDDIDTGQTGGGVRTMTSGTAGARRFTIQWNADKKGSKAGAPGVFQVVFTENSENVLFVYRSTVFNGGAGIDNGVGATIGIQGTSGLQGKQFSLNSASVSSGTALLLTAT